VRALKTRPRRAAGAPTRRLGGGGLEHRVEQQRRVLDQRQLLLLLLGHEARERDGVVDLGQLLQPPCQCRRIGKRRRQHVDGVGGGVRILHQIEQRRHRLDLDTAQVQRIEVELEARQQRDAECRDGP